MSKLFKLALILAMFAVSIPAFSKDDIPVEIQKKLQENMALGSTAQGYEFYLAIPPNEVSTYAIGDLVIYVSSTKPTEVSLQVGATGALISKKKIISPLGVVTFSNATGEINHKGNEVRIPETPLDMGLRVISSSNPISVYCLNSKGATSDGYMAIPTSSWGTDYIHCAYYDKHEGTDNAMGIQYFGAGFIVIAAENATKVQIELKGVGGDFASTTSGRKPGQPTYEVTLNKGQVYLVQGDGTSLGSFDLTGSRIKSDKPIGLFSYHQRTDLPGLIGSSRDHLVEMIPPVQSWGKKYATIEFERNNRGDLFRIVSSEPMTKYSVSWYDMKSDEILGTRVGTLKRAGDFVDISEIMQAPGAGYNSIRGVANFEGNKPIFVMHYSYSTDWDGNDYFDPFMVCVASVEQFTKTTIFQTPGGEFTNNHFNIIAVGDTLDYAKHVKLIESIKIDGKPVHTMAAQFKQARIPNTNLFWARIKVNPGAHYIVGDTPFGGYIYGYTFVDSYGWPAAMAINILDQTDTLEPEVYIEGTCGEYEVRYTELRNGFEGDDPKQVDLGVSERPSLLDGSINFNEPDFGFGFIPHPPNYDNTFKLKVTDLKEDAVAIIGITDRAGNVTVKEIYYNAAKIAIDPEISLFGNVRVNTTKDLPIKIQNIGSSISEILSIDFKSGSVFSFVNKPTVPFAINDGEDLPLDIRYSPTKESASPATMDVDSIIITTECLRFAFPVNGRGVLPKIKVPDWDAGTLVVGEQVCLNGGLVISNPGTMDLVITGFDWAKTDPSFTISNPTKPPFPFTIKAGATQTFNTICFKPIEEKSYFEAVIVFKSNRESGRDTAIFVGRSVQPGPEITSHNWLRRRVLDDAAPGYPGSIVVTNSGSSKIRLERIDLMLDATTPYVGTDYVITSTLPNLVNGPVDIFPKTDTDPTHAKELVVNFTFNPKSEDNVKKIEVWPIFSAADKIDVGSIVGILEGVAYLPAIDAKGYEFVNAQIVGTVHPDDQGTIEISSLSATADLYIQRINVVDVTPNSTQDFNFAQALPTNFVLPMGEVLTIPVEFTPSRIGRREIRLDIVNDAFKANDSIRITPITVVGFGRDESFEATNINFGTLTRCENSVMSFFVRNTGFSDAFTVDRIEIDPEFSDIFTIQNFVPGQAVLQQGEIEYTVLFDPTKRPVQIHNNNANVVATVTIYTSIGVQTVTFEGRTILSQVKLFSVPMEKKMTAGLLTTGEHEFPTFIELNQNASQSGVWNDTKITNFTVEINYNPHWMQFKDVVTAGEVINGWSVTGVEKIHSETSATLTVTGTGTNPISGNGKLFNPTFLILLSDSSKFSPQFGNISFGDRDACVSSISSPGRIELQHCVQDLRNVKIEGTKFSMIPINPNPVSTGAASLEFSIGLDNVYTKIEVINSMGEIVRTLQDGEMNVGSYRATILTNELSSGVYFINMVSGPFKQREKLVISK